jgi:transposase
MSKARLVITAVTVEKRPVSEVAKSYGVARSWIYTLLARYEAEGEAAFEPRSRRPKSSTSATSPGTVELIVRLRKELAGQGLDAGPQTIARHLEQHHQVKVSPATVSRCLSRNGLVIPDPSKRPKSSCIRFAAEMPNECWQSDFTHYPLVNGTDTEILTWLDDHSRYALSLTAHHRVTGPAVLLAFRADPEELAPRPAPPARHPHRAPGPARRLRRHLQHQAPAPLTPRPRHPGSRLRRPAEGQPGRPDRRHPRPRPHRPHRRDRARHPPAQRTAPPHRHRTPPCRNARPAPGPGPAHPRHQRRHR